MKSGELVTKHEVLKTYFGYDSFRAGQEEIIDSVLDKKDALAIMPTGAGKSICYQVPAMIGEGVSIVVSPLISLMQDQVLSLTEAGIRAAYINSSLTYNQMRDAMYGVRSGYYKLIYVAPERLLSEDFINFAEYADIKSVTIDEAHCISRWGQDFRPSYMDIPKFIARLKSRPVVSAFTATATTRVKDDIIAALGLVDPTILVTGFDRENLSFEVQMPASKSSALLSFLKNNQDKSGIIYCITRKIVESVCETLQSKGYLATRYHAGLPDSERRRNQEDFLYDRKTVMVATNAFGMGIDKSNVSYVVHYNMPRDMESYYQEAGRAGRDGAPAKCLLLYSGQDVGTNRWMIENLGSEGEEGIERRRDNEFARLREMTSYCMTSECLRAYILRYFGETPPSFCGNCGNCNTNFDTVDITTDAQKILSCIYRMNERFGVNMVVDVLKGSKNKAVQRMGFDSLSTYGICQNSAAELRYIISTLIEKGYIAQSDGQFPILMLTAKSWDILKSRERLEIKMPKEKIKDTKEKESATLGVVDNTLYEKLRKLRGDIAKEEKMPAYIIFTDKSLASMAVIQPTSLELFKSVSGVGEAKHKRYGERFVTAIAEHMGIPPDLTEVEQEEHYEELAAEMAEGDEIADLRAVATDQVDIEVKSLFEELREKIEVTEDAVSISVITKRINEVMEGGGYPKVTAIKLGKWLEEMGLLETVHVDERHTVKVPTEKGTAMGITPEEREHEGNYYFINMYPYEVQRYMAENIDKIMEFSE